MQKTQCSSKSYTKTWVAFPLALTSFKLQDTKRFKTENISYQFRCVYYSEYYLNRVVWTRIAPACFIRTSNILLKAQRKIATINPNVRPPQQHVRPPQQSPINRNKQNIVVVGAQQQYPVALNNQNLFIPGAVSPGSLLAPVVRGQGRMPRPFGRGEPMGRGMSIRGQGQPGIGKFLLFFKSGDILSNLPRILFSRF